MHFLLTWRFNEDCGFACCNYREHQTHFHCMRKDCNYRFCDKTRFVQHTARHERLDTLCGEEFEGFRGVPCGRPNCELNALHARSKQPYFCFLFFLTFCPKNRNFLSQWWKTFLPRDRKPSNIETENSIKGFTLETHSTEWRWVFDGWVQVLLLYSFVQVFLASCSASIISLGQMVIKRTSLWVIISGTAM